MNAVSLLPNTQRKRDVKGSEKWVKNLNINTLIPKFKFKNHKGETTSPKNDILL